MLVVIGRNGIDVMTTRELFDFVTRYSLKPEEYDTVIENVSHSIFISHHHHFSQ